MYKNHFESFYSSVMCSSGKIFYNCKHHVNCFSLLEMNFPHESDRFFFLLFCWDFFKTQNNIRNATLRASQSSNDFMSLNFPNHSDGRKADKEAFRASLSHIKTGE